MAKNTNIAFRNNGKKIVGAIPVARFGDARIISCQGNAAFSGGQQLFSTSERPHPIAFVHFDRHDHAQCPYCNKRFVALEDQGHKHKHK